MPLSMHSASVPIFVRILNNMLAVARQGRGAISPQWLWPDGKDFADKRKILSHDESGTTSPG